MKKVFLGGTCADSQWREKLIPLLTIEYFNPVVEDWTEEAQQEEIEQRQSCDYVLYVITPRMKGVYSIAEIVDDSNKRPKKTVFCVLETDNDDEGKEITFEDFQLKSLNQVKEMVKNNRAKVLNSLEEIAEYLNSQEQIEERVNAIMNKSFITSLDKWKKFNKFNI